MSFEWISLEWKILGVVWFTNSHSILFSILFKKGICFNNFFNIFIPMVHSNFLHWNRIFVLILECNPPLSIQMISISTPKTKKKNKKTKKKTKKPPKLHILTSQANMCSDIQTIHVDHSNKSSQISISLPYSNIFKLKCISFYLFKKANQIRDWIFIWNRCPNRSKANAIRK